MDQAHVISLYKDTNITNLPPGSTLLYDIVTETQAHSLYKKYSQQRGLNKDFKSLSCLYPIFQPYVPTLLNHVDFKTFGATEEMDWERDDPAQFYPSCIILNIGSTVVFELETLNKLTSYKFLFPANSALILKNSTDYKRGFLRGHGVFNNHKVEDRERLGIVLRCKKQK